MGPHQIGKRRLPSISTRHAHQLLRQIVSGSKSNQVFAALIAVKQVPLQSHHVVCVEETFDVGH